jgi:hypothetical protein
MISIYAISAELSYLSKYGIGLHIAIMISFKHVLFFFSEFCTSQLSLLFTNWIKQVMLTNLSSNLVTLLLHKYMYRLVFSQFSILLKWKILSYYN